MKHRGRHRRRKRGQALRAFLAATALALTAAATMISASQATVTDDPGALKPLASAADLDPLRLTEQLQPTATLDRLAAGMGRPVGVSAVLAGADHTLRDAADCAATEKRALPVEPPATRAYCWNTADIVDWQPGAVTTSGDADDDGRWGANRVILSAWSHSGGQGPARVAFVDAGDLGHLAYTWVLLAVPVDGGRDYRGLASDVSGMAWYQDKLFVTAGSGDGAALYVYDVNRIQRAGVDSPAVGRVPGGWSAAGARFVLPAISSYRLTGDDSARPDALSVDRSTVPDSLVVSERVPEHSDRGTRLWRYSFSTDPGRVGLLAGNPEGQVEAAQAYETRRTEVRGVLAYRSQWYLSRAADVQDGRGALWLQDADGARVTRCGTDETRSCWSTRTQSLSYWEATGEVWSQSDGVLFALPLASITSALK